MNMDRFFYYILNIYYKSKCANIGKTEKISLVDYMFPNNICYYPYQACSRSKTGQSGGAKSEGIISNFAAYEHSGAKCITLAYDTTIYGEKPIPYNIADFAANNIKSEFLNKFVLLFTSCASIKCSLGNFKYPKVSAISRFFSILLPITHIFLLCLNPVSIACATL